MNKYYAKKFKMITILSIIFVLVLPISKKYGYKTYIDDEGPDVTSSGATWKSTCESRETSFSQINPDTGTNFKISDFKVNEDYGWYEWFYDNTNYVVVGAATLEGLEDVPSTDYSFVKKQDNIHYFHYGTAQNDWNFSTFEFKVDDEKKSKGFTAIVLNTYPQALDPSNKGWNGYKLDGETYKAKSKNTQWIKFYVSADYKEKYEKLENATLQMTSDGVFSSSAGTTKSEKKRNMFSEFFTSVFTTVGDAFQKLLNGNVIKAKITYTRADIQASSSLNGEIQVEDSTSTNDESENTAKYRTINTVNISKTTENRKGQTATAYTKETEIPVIPTDLYSFCIGYVNLFDVNFFNTNTENPNGFWMFIRNFVASAKNVIIYIVAALMIVLIIWRAILYVLATLGDNPESGKESKRIMNNIVKALLIIGSIYLIMIIITYLYNEILKIYLNGNNSIYLIRVNVDGVYSFNTNYIGLLKFRSLSADSDAALGYAFWYMACSFFTLLAYGIMLFRTLYMAFLTLIAPVIALHEMNGNVNGNDAVNILNFRRFLRVYTVLTFIPLAIIFITRVAIRLI